MASMYSRLHRLNIPSERGGRACRPHWDGSVNTLLTVSAAKVQGLVGAREPFEQFVHVSGAASLDRAFAQLRVRLAEKVRQGALRTVLRPCARAAFVCTMLI
jgi:hypothetical protein